MQKLDFGEALDLIHSKDPRFDRAAYHFLRDALDYTIKMRKKAKEGTGHVNGQQLLEGIRQYAIKQFGPMVPTVLAYWGISRCDDFGEMVFNLIRVNIFGKTENDSLDDFRADTISRGVCGALPAGAGPRCTRGLDLTHRPVSFGDPSGPAPHV